MLVFYDTLFRMHIVTITLAKQPMMESYNVIRTFHTFNDFERKLDDTEKTTYQSLLVQTHITFTTTSV